MDFLEGLVSGCAISARCYPDVRVAHIEAGLRSGDLTMPEEVARIQMDAISHYLFPPTEHADQNLKNDNVSGKSWVVGNLIVDALEMIVPASEAATFAYNYAVMTLHRPENVDDPVRFQVALDYIEGLVEKEDLVVIWPVHPRARKLLKMRNIKLTERFQLLDPVGYAEMIALMQTCCLVVTDSGGLQEEAAILGKPCVTLRKNTERPETLEIGANILVDVVKAMRTDWHCRNVHAKSWEHPYGSEVARKIADIFEQEFGHE